MECLIRDLIGNGKVTWLREGDLNLRKEIYSNIPSVDYHQYLLSNLHIVEFFPRAHVQALDK